jgi:hypothetical protein
VRALTENLIQKQTVIEALSTEKSSLVLQLERLEVREMISIWWANTLQKYSG